MKKLLVVLAIFVAVLSMTVLLSACTEPETEPTLTEVRVVSRPVDMIYEDGDSIDISEFTYELVYSDDSIVFVDVNSPHFDNFVVKDATGNEITTVSYEFVTDNIYMYSADVDIYYTEYAEKVDSFTYFVNPPFWGCYYHEDSTDTGTYLVEIDIRNGLLLDKDQSGLPYTVSLPDGVYEITLTYMDDTQIIYYTPDTDTLSYGESSADCLQKVNSNMRIVSVNTESACFTLAVQNNTAIDVDVIKDHLDLAESDTITLTENGQPFSIDTAITYDASLTVQVVAE